jgi:hypothetical protein
MSAKKFIVLDTLGDSDRSNADEDAYHAADRAGEAPTDRGTRESE